MTEVTGERQKRRLGHCAFLRISVRSGTARVLSSYSCGPHISMNDFLKRLTAPRQAVVKPTKSKTPDPGSGVALRAGELSDPEPEVK